MCRTSRATRSSAIALSAMLLLLAPSARAGAESVALVLKAGTPIHVALDRRIAIARVGQIITGTLVEPVYAYDRVVLPAGSAVRGHVAALEPASRHARLLAFAAADFSPHRHIVVQFDSVTLAAGRELAVRTVVTMITARTAIRVAATPGAAGVTARARQEIADRASEAITTITAPGKMERLKDAFIERLPYHKQFLRRGTVFTAELLAPIDFGLVEATPRAAPGTQPAPESILAARLLTSLDSSRTARGATVRAVVTHPVFSAAHELILPEGVILEGTVTFVRPARHFRRNGQLRFLFQTARPTDEDPVTMLASLYAIRTAAGDQVAVDEEGGATVTNSNTRFIAPALSILALRAAMERSPDVPDPGEVAVPGRFDYGNPALGGFFGWGLLGAAVSQFVPPPVGIGLSMVGVARTVYGTVFGKGREVIFPAHTPIELQLAPARGREP